MTTKAATGKGTVLSIGTPGTGETFTSILQVKTFKLSGQKWTYEDITNMGSPSLGVGTLKESLPTLVDAGELALSGIFLPSDPGQLAAAAAFGTGLLMDFKLQLPINAAAGQVATGNLYAFSGFVQEQPIPDLQYDKVQSIAISIKLNTPVVTTPGA
jgi:hypothetical protein